MSHRLVLSLSVLLALPAAAPAASSPAALASALQKALDAGDFAAAGALADIEGAPAETRFAYFDTVYGCASDMTCKVIAAPLDADFKAGLIEDAKATGAAPIEAEGVIVVSQKSHDGSGSGELKMPYAKSGADYRIRVMRPGASALAEAKARSNEDLVKALFAEGIYDTKSGSRRTDWASAASALPKDGGEPGRALVASTNAMAKAVDAKDPDAAMHSGGRWAAFVFADKGYDGKPLAIEQRRRKLHAQSQRMLRDVRVEGGYALGDDAVVVFTARNGSGWIERGAALLSREGGAWDVAGKKTVSYPAD